VQVGVDFGADNGSALVPSRPFAGEPCRLLARRESLPKDLLPSMARVAGKLANRPAGSQAARQRTRLLAADAVAVAVEAAGVAPCNGYRC
jgi:hypothetical protein